MKNKIYTIFLLGLSLLLLSTCKNPEIGYETFTITDESIEPEVYGAKVNGSFSFSGNVQEMKMKIATDESLTDATDYSTIIDNQTFSAEIEGLEPNTTYYYCYSINFGWKDDYLTDINSFTTLKGFPTVKTLEIIALYDASFRIKCEVTSDGGSDIMERGLYWNNVGNPNLDDNKIIHDESGVGEYVCLMDNLEPNTTYYVRAYAKNDTGIGLAQEVLRFETQDHPNDSLTIVTDCNPPDGGSATGGGTFASGQRCTVTATANEGYAFTRWTENGNQVSTEASYTFTVDRNRTLMANFTKNTYNVTVSASDGGTATGGGTFSYGQSCTVRAIPATDYTFTNWTENGSVVSTNANYTFTVDRNRTLKANFTENPSTTYNVTVSANPTEGGTVTGGGTYQQGQSCTVVATPAANFTFINWTENGGEVSTNANYTFTVTSNRTLEAHFINGQQNFTITVSANPAYAGYVTGGGTYQHGQSCTVVATPATANYTFINWTENGSVVCTNASYNFNVNANRTLVANFTAHASSDAINGIFTISPYNDHVYFSQGNLQYKASQGTWRFAEHQWDYVGGTTNDNVIYGTVYENGVRCSNNMISQTYSGWIDLFGWGTGNNPTNSSSNTNNYSTFTDWGINPIGNSVNQWRTLTQTEWDHILNEREASSLNGVPNARYAKAKVSDVAGLILFPDNYNHPDNIPISGINDPGTNYSVNEYNSSQWSQMQHNGCVFLPAAGRRNGTHFTLEFNDGQDGYYWSSPCDDCSGVLHFDNNHLKANDGIARYMGLCVRLVYPIIILTDGY